MAYASYSIHFTYATAVADVRELGDEVVALTFTDEAQGLSQLSIFFKAKDKERVEKIAVLINEMASPPSVLPPSPVQPKE